MIVKAKQVTLKELGNEIMALSINPIDGSHAKSILKEKDNEIYYLKKQLNIHVN